MKRILALILSVLLIITAVPSAVFSVEPETDEEPTHESQTGTPDEALVRQIGIWLNNVYGNVPGFGSAPTDGTVTYALIAALLRAFQIELGITSPANNFGPQTTARYEASPLPDPDVTEDARYAILSAALICRGYDPGEKITQTEDKISLSGVYDEALERAILSLKRDAGLPTDSPLIDTELMKAVFSTMRFTPYPERGNAVFCETQRYINANFRDYTGLIPCDGLYDRDLVFAMIRTVQAALGLPKDEITYRFGPLTRSLFPTLPYDAAAENAGRRYPGDKTGDLFSDKDVEALTVVLQTALIGNGFDPGSVTGTWNEQTEEAVRAFQAFRALEETGRCDAGTMNALLQANGDPERPAFACDTALILGDAEIALLKENGYTLIGRYLTGTYGGGIPKAISKTEAQALLDAGIGFYPIFQDGGNWAEDFDAETGASDALDAVDALYTLGVPDGATVYFAVDFDATAEELEQRVIPYFTAVKTVFDRFPFRVGVYGSRRVCSVLAKKGLTTASFVGDLAYLFSGNISYPMPENWTFDQFATVDVTGNSLTLEVDKNAVSGRDTGVTALCERDFSTLFKLGDADLDGVVTAADARIALRMAVGLEKVFPGSPRFMAADHDKDNAVTAADARRILREAVGLTNEPLSPLPDEKDDPSPTDPVPIDDPVPTEAE